MNTLQALHTRLPWGMEITQNDIWIGPMRHDGRKVAEIAVRLDYGSTYTEEARAQVLANAELIVSSVNGTLISAQSGNAGLVEALKTELKTWPMNSEASMGLSRAIRIAMEHTEAKPVGGDDEIERLQDEIGVWRLAQAMKAKLAKKREQGHGGWWDGNRCETAYLEKLLREHIAKGDLTDIANFCMMLFNRGVPHVAALTSQDGGANAV